MLSRSLPRHGNGSPVRLPIGVLDRASITGSKYSRHNEHAHGNEPSAQQRGNGSGQAPSENLAQPGGIVRSAKHHDACNQRHNARERLPTQRNPCQNEGEAQHGRHILATIAEAIIIMAITIAAIPRHLIRKRLHRRSVERRARHHQKHGTQQANQQRNGREGDRGDSKAAHSA